MANTVAATGTASNQTTRRMKVGIAGLGVGANAVVKAMEQAPFMDLVAAADVRPQALTAFQQSPELYQRLLSERNQNWMPHVERCLTDNAGCFVVVGAAHLVGQDGLPVLLRKKGYKVTQQ